MKALRFSKFGPPSVLVVEDIPTPEPGKGEVLVQIKATAAVSADPLIARFKNCLREVILGFLSFERQLGVHPLKS
jgi:NADPH:quinone reductase-like Zn-dependent oxidoreductase